MDYLIPENLEVTIFVVEFGEKLNFASKYFCTMLHDVFFTALRAKMFISLPANIDSGCAQSYVQNFFAPICTLKGNLLQNPKKSDLHQHICVRTKLHSENSPPLLNSDKVRSPNYPSNPGTPVQVKDGRFAGSGEGGCTGDTSLAADNNVVLIPYS